jgi:uncharacterized protein YheU (UPF0270 family)
MSEHTEVIIERDQHNDQGEEGIDVPLDRINPDTLRNMVVEYVTRDWSELTDAKYTLDDKIGQVIQQLKDGRAKVVFDLTTGTCNIIPAGKTAQ